MNLDDGGQYHASKLQLWYWECWSRLWDHVERLKAQLGAEVWVLVGGDEIEGDHHHTTEVWFVNEADQDRALAEVYQRPFGIGDRWVFVRGTPAHDGPVAARTEARLQRWAAQGMAIVGGPVRLSHWLWTGRIGGLRVQAKHEPTARGWLPHTREAAAHRQAHHVWEEYHQQGIEPPDIALFHHTHYHARGQYQDTACFFIPGWQAPTAWNWRRRASPGLHWPGALLVVVQDRFWYGDFRLYRPRREIW